MNQLMIKKKNELKTNKKKGFTLVELIIVIAIIAILAAIAMPKFGTIKQDANLKTDIATGKSIATIVAKGIASDIIDTTENGFQSIASIKKLPSGTMNIADELDGTSTPKTGTVFKIKITTGGNIEVYVDEAKRVFPQ